MALLTLLALLAGACTDPGTDAEAIRVGAGSTTEQQIVAALTRELFARNDLASEIVPDLGDTIDVRQNGLNDRIDVYWDYSGAAWALSLGLPAPPVDPEESFEVVATEEAGNGLRWLGPSQVDARLTFFVRTDSLAQDSGPNLSWLASQLGRDRGVLCADAQYLESLSGYAFLADTYAISPEAVMTRAAAENEAVQATADGECLAGLATATSGTAAAAELLALADDQGVFPAQVLAPVVVRGGRAEDPLATRLLDTLAGVLTVEGLADLNAQADLGTPIDQLAIDFLDQVGLN